MVAAKRTAKAKKMPKRTQQAKQRVPRPTGGMAVEKAVRDYIMLLKDPCNGPLVGPVGATANGYITRFESTHVVNPNHPNWAMRWTPGSLNFTGSGVGGEGGLAAYEAATAGGAFTTTPLSNDDAPGYTFLRDTCQTYRCLAACVQVRYTDTEVNRRGIVGSTICTGARAFASSQEAISITVDRARIPDQSLEVLWQPGDGDELFTANQVADFDTETKARKNAILLAGTSCLTGSVTIRMVAVYQWTPSSADNIVLPVPTPGTGVTLARVIQIARQAGFVAGHLIKGYATGGLYGVAREAASMVKPSRITMA